MNTTTTTPYIARLEMHPDTQIKTDLTIMAGAIAFMIALWMCFSLCAKVDPHRDCALRITRGLSPHQGKLLTRGTPTYNHAAQWCSAHPNHDAMIERAKTWPTFPTH